MIKSKTTLSKEQIEALRVGLYKVADDARRCGAVDEDAHSQASKEFDALCNMALQYLEMKDAVFKQGRGGKSTLGRLIEELNLVPGPKPYDPKDKGTWPSKNTE